MKKTLISTLIASCYAFAGPAVFADDAYDPENLTISEQVESGGSLEERVNANTQNIETNSQDVVTNIFSIYENSVRINRLEDQVSDSGSGAVTYDYRDYLTPSTISQKVFAASGTDASSSLADLTTVTRDYSHSNDGGVPTVSVLVNRYDSLGQLLNNPFERHFSNGEGYGLFTGWTTYDQIDNARVISEAQYSNGGIKRFDTAFKPGDTVVDAAVRSRTIYNPDGTVAFQDDITFQTSYVISRFEDVTVPYNGGTTYSDCMVVQIEFRSISSSATSVQATNWLCPGVGLVQRARSGRGFYQLSDIVTE